MNPGIQNYGGFIKDPSLFIKNLPAMQAMWVPSLGGEDSLEEGVQYSCLDNPQDRGAGGLESIGSQSLTLLRRLSTHTPEAQLVLFIPGIYPTSRKRQS